MESWKLQALLSALFAGVTAVIAKFGLENISADLGVAIRTGFVFFYVLVVAFSTRGSSGVANLTFKHFGLLALSAATTALSWIFYYRAVKAGQVSVVAVIDKASILFTLAASFLLLREPMSPRVLSGAALVLAGLLVIAVKK